MAKFLIFDADKSLTALGTQADIQTLSGFPEVPVTGGLEQLAPLIGVDIGKGISKMPLFSKQVSQTQHPLFPQTNVAMMNYVPSPLVQQNKIEGFVVDSISHIFGQDLRLIEAKNNSKKIEQQDWGTLERMYLTFFEAIKHIPSWVVVNCHTTYDKGEDGKFYYYPLLKGQSKERIREFFDVVVYTKVSPDKKQYMWQTFADTSRMAKDRINVLDPTMPQELNTIISRYQAKGYQPKILVIGESGTGKTKSIASLAKLP